MAESGLVRSPFTINRAASGVTFLGTDLDTVSDWRTILTYAVPLGVAIEITPVNYIFAQIKTTGATAITAGLSRLLKQNANGTESRELWSGSNAVFKDIGDEFQRPKVRVPVVVSASQVLLWQVYALATTLDVSASDVQVECIQYYEEI